ncbi:MAG: DUF4199 domain-containing protein [Saprospiraceae bacterium]
MNSIVVKNGLLASVSAIVLGLIVYLISPKGFLTWGSWLTMVPLVYFMVQAAKETRETIGGFATLREVFTPAWITYLFYAIASTLFTYVMLNFIDTGLLDLARQASIEAIEKLSGMMGEEATQAAIEELEKSNPYSISKLAIGVLFSLVFPGALIALIIGLVLKKQRPEDWA